MTDPDAEKSDRNQRFHDFYKERFRDVSGFVRRRVGASDAADVIAQVFAVAWRRFEQIPQPPEDRLWLFGVARRAVADHRRSGLRRFRLHERLFEQIRPSSFHGDVDPLLAQVEIAIARLRPKDREVLRLVLWDDLTHAEASTILGCTPNAVELRYRRAQARVRDALALTAAPIDPIDAPAAPVCEWRTQP
jgi:RNA polymerase sigma factor (sigma-70 family)